MNILGLIPARGGSKGIPGKNVTMLHGKPLITYTFDAAKESKQLTRTILSTDDETIAALGRSAGIDVPFLRPAHLATDEAPMVDVLVHVLEELNTKEQYKPDAIVLLQPTSPLRQSKHIDEAVDLLIETGADTVVSVVPVPHNFTPNSLMRLENGHLVPLDPGGTLKLRRQDKQELYARNGPAILVIRVPFLLREKNFYGSNTQPYVMDKAESLDIDDSFDLRLAEFLLGGK